MTGAPLRPPASVPRRAVIAGSPLGPSADDAGANDRVRLSLRLVVHLSRYEPTVDGGPARPESTQEGIALALSATQGAVSKVLRLLSYAEMVRHERRHVPGRDRNVRAYYLTRRGELLAAEMRTRPGDGSDPQTREPFAVRREAVASGTDPAR